MRGRFALPIFGRKSSFFFLIDPFAVAKPGLLTLTNQERFMSAEERSGESSAAQG
jgi:hypothetical protein